jgi:UDP-N-acetylglucosamine transferase subunit ALG13
MLVTEPGGHLTEMIGLRSSWGEFPHRWVTLASPDTRSLLAGERVEFATGPTSRDWLKLALNIARAWRHIPSVRPSVVLTTGGPVSIPYCLVARMYRIPIVYVECGGRADRPSVALRVIAPIASRVYVQWPALLDGSPNVRFVGRVRFSRDDQLPFAPPQADSVPIAEIVATVGTCEYPFDRLVSAIDEVGSTHDVLVQTGVSRVRPRFANGVPFMPFGALSSHMEHARVVVTHAGIGSILLAHAHGKRPIVVPRRHDLGEQVDDHQIGFARAMADEGQIVLVEDPADLRDAIERHSAELATPPANGDYPLADELRGYFEQLLA